MEREREAGFYRKAAGDAVECLLCARRCRIPEGESGFCRVRRNVGGTLYSLVYGRLIARHMDPIEKKPLFHFLPGTGSYSIATPGCNFRCSFCQNWQISQMDAAPALQSLGYVRPEEVVEAALEARAASIAYTYTEPTIFMEYALDCARLAREHGMRNVFVTNGFESPEAVEAMRGLIDAANVDLKSFRDEFYRHFCKARLQPVVETIANMREAGILVEVTTLLVPGQNDSPEELRELTAFLAGISPDIPWHVSRFYPNYKETDLSPTPVESMLRARQIGKEAGLRYIYLGNVLIEGSQDTVCPGCGRVLIHRLGYSRPSVRLKEPKCPDCGHAVPVVLG